MLRSVCQCVLFLVLSGCFLSHGDDDAVPARDAGTDARVSRPDGAMPWPDASTPTPPPDCWAATESVRANRACVPNSYGTIPPGSNYSLDVFLDGCWCDEDLSCTASVLMPGVLALETRVCPGRADCDGCVPSVRASCPIPALTEGTWQVRVNGTPAFDVTVAPPAPGLLPQQTCYDFAPPSEDTATMWCDWPGTWMTGSTEVCHPSQARPGESVTIRVADTCATCFVQPGQCELSVIGDRIVVSPQERYCECATCGACPEVCMRLERTCTTPPLEAGTYTIASPAGETTLVIGEGTMAPDVCAGSIGGG